VKIAVVGAGIAGAGAAWSLTQAGFAVEVFEAGPELGGNARTHTWQTPGGPITAGLAVLAWPEAYFNNYRCLLDRLAIAHEPVRLRFFVRASEAYFAHGADGLGGSLAERYGADLRRWRRLIDRVRVANRRFSGGGPPSLYRVSYANPMVYTPAWPLARLFGVSRAFWDDVVVALYATSFLTTRLDGLPAVILPTIDDLVSVEEGGRMRSWSGHSGAVFDALVAGAGVHRNRAIVRVRGDDRGVELHDAAGDRHHFDRVVLAGDAQRMATALDPGTHAAASRLLSRVRYVERRDPTFSDGRAHADASVLPDAHRTTILRDHCTFVDLVDTPAGRRYENHFVVSSWAPVARGRDAVMLVSYGLPPERALAGDVRAFNNRGAHPDLSIANLLVARRLRAVQGRGGVYYCGSYATPGNGHDLSLLSGLVVADAIGAPHPFSADPAARADFKLLQRMMLGASA
jgi:predicted NAD/FAD-binding protein